MAKLKRKVSLGKLLPMERTAIKDLLERLQQAIEKARRAAEQAKESENEMSKTARASSSAAGEREYTRQQAEITQESLKKLEALEKEVAEAAEKPVPAVVGPVCWVAVEYEDGGRTETFYFVSKSLYLAGTKLISPGSPIGAAVLGRRTGEGFEFEVGAERVRGKITGIE